MEITFHHDLNRVEIWLTNADQKNEKMQAWLKKQYPVWRSQKLLPVVYHSGHEDLYDNTLALLKHNRTASARREMKLKQ